MKQYSLATLVIIISISFNSCVKDEWFDLKVDKQLAVPQTLVDLQALLDNGGLFNTNSPTSVENATDAHYFSSANEAQLVGFEKNAFIWTKGGMNINVTDWLNGSNGSYKKVYVANLVLESLKKVESTDEQDLKLKNEITGQALFFRSKTFYELAQVFTPLYIPGENDSSKLGIPLRLESDISLKGRRSTIKETYDRIIDDLIQASGLLPTTSQYPTRPTKNAAYAMLARVYLSISNYADAKRYADLVLQNYSTLINYSTLNYNSSLNPFQGYNSEIIFYSFMSGGLVFVLSNVLVKEDLYELYAEEDLRKLVFFNRSASTGSIAYKGTYAGRGFRNFFNGLATDEMYLVRSECYAREGKVGEAMEDLNTLLKSRWNGPYTDIISSNEEEALVTILQERRKEMVFRGVRWSDLRRLNRDARFATTLTRTLSGTNYTLEPNSYKYTLPIPDDIIQMSGMEQNPGWE